MSVDLDFEQFRVFLEKTCGILLGNNKQYLVSSRLNKLMEQQGIKTLGDLVRKIQAQPRSGLREQVVDAMTTNETLWFRDTYPFDVLKSRVLPEMLKTGSGQRLRIWSAACSSGQEPYSIAIAAREAGRRAAIVATDIDHAILERARSARYRDGELTGIPPQSRQQFFAPEGDEWVLRQPVRDMVRFEHMNLHGAWTFDGPFDVIFCRNVIIYFDAAAQLRLWDKFCRQLRPGGWLLIGHSERIPDHLRTRLRPVGHTVYQYDPGRGET